MRPSTGVSTDHIASMSFLVKSEIVIIFFGNIFIAHPKCNPLKIINVDSKSECFDTILKVETWIHQSHLINWIHICSDCKWIYDIDWMVMHILRKSIEIIWPKSLYFTYYFFHFLSLLFKFRVKALNFNVYYVANINIGVF